MENLKVCVRKYIQAAALAGEEGAKLARETCTEDREECVFSLGYNGLDLESGSLSLSLSPKGNLRSFSFLFYNPRVPALRLSFDVFVPRPESGFFFCARAPVSR